MVELGLTSETLSLFEKAPTLLIEPSFLHNYIGGFNYCVSLRQSSITKAQYCSLFKTPKGSPEKSPYTRDCQAQDVQYIYNLFLGCRELNYSVSSNLEALCLWMGKPELTDLGKRAYWAVFKEGRKTTYFGI